MLKQHLNILRWWNKDKFVSKQMLWQAVRISLHSPGLVLGAAGGRELRSFWTVGTLR
jgi:hypothetical protein